MPFTTEGKKELFTAFAKARKKFAVPQRTKTAQGGKFNFKYAPLEEIIAATEPALSEHGLLVFNNVTMPGQNVVAVTAVIVHEDTAQFHETEPLIFQIDGSPQSIGSATTYGRRYSQSALLGIASEEDTDAQNIREGKGQQQQPKQQQKPQQQQPEPAEEADPATADEPITTAQVERLKRLVKAAKISGADMKAWLKSMDIESSAKITRGQYQSIVSIVQSGKVPAAK